MSAPAPRFAIVASTGGGVMDALLANEFFARHVAAVLSDRDCPAIEKARRHGVPTNVIRQPSVALFCARLLEYLETSRVDYVVSFFTRLFVGELLRRYADRIINLHPSLLPSFKGLHGFEEAVSYGVRFVGTTIHFVDERMDTGRIIMQTVRPLDPTCDPRDVRHAIFAHQCRSLLQVMRWLVDGRILLTERGVVVRDARYDDREFSPALDFRDAIELPIGPRPTAPAGGAR